MAKKKTLRQQVQSLPDGKRRKRKNWCEKLEESKPKFYAELCELVDAWLSLDDMLRSKFPEQAHLEKWLQDVILENAGVDLSPTSIKRLIHERAASRG